MQYRTPTVSLFFRKLLSATLDDKKDLSCLMGPQIAFEVANTVQAQHEMVYTLTTVYESNLPQLAKNYLVNFIRGGAAGTEGVSYFFTKKALAQIEACKNFVIENADIRRLPPGFYVMEGQKFIDYDKSKNRRITGTKRRF